MYQVGDILRGFFPRSDGAHGTHYAVVVREIGRFHVGLMGTSKRVGRASGSQLVLRPEDVSARVWDSTGLPVKPGRFDFDSGRLVTIGPLSSRYREEIVGSIAADPVWAATFRRLTALTDERIRRLIQARA